ncbi:energy transducer TonB [Pedobacter xixiisoli]|uniref:TonB family C-terminal domain-containing protein n=1 Tax=Pedobacter xixiisoli TaxID=1476464 RepID=A0A286A8Y4_9SPHI|nr:energy transducer TonB [Pedobacter xixiisoli]SOD18374.1 TonB family C-terminal domain-containing protein [Pedobacter xixiisoli]
MIRKIKLTAIIAFGISALCFAQGRTPDFAFKLENTSYIMNLSNGKAKAKNDTVFYNLYRIGKAQRIAKEIKHIVNKATGDTIKSGSYEVINNQIFFYQKEKNKATLLRLYTQNEKGLLTLQTAVASFVGPKVTAPAAPGISPSPSTDHLTKVDIQAEFPGGISKARQFIANNLKYPREAQENEIEGTVRVKFMVELDGSISNIEIVNKLGYGLDQEVIRVIKRMPKWAPAKNDGKPVRSYFTMPISFRVN